MDKPVSQRKASMAVGKQKQVSTQGEQNSGALSSSRKGLGTSTPQRPSNKRTADTQLGLEIGSARRRLDINASIMKPSQGSSSKRNHGLHQGNKFYDNNLDDDESDSEYVEQEIVLEDNPDKQPQDDTFDLDYHDGDDTLDNEEHSILEPGSDVDQGNELDMWKWQFSQGKKTHGPSGLPSGWIEVNKTLQVPKEMHCTDVQQIITRAGKLPPSQLSEMLRKKRHYDSGRGLQWENEATGLEDGMEAWNRLNRGAKIAFARYLWFPDTVINKLISEVADRSQIVIDVDSGVGVEMWKKICSWRKNWWQQWVENIRSCVQELCKQNSGYHLLKDKDLIKAYTKHWSVSMLFQNFGIVKDMVNWEATCRKPEWITFYRTLWVYSMVYIHRNVYDNFNWSKEKVLTLMKLIAVNPNFKGCLLKDLVLNPMKPVKMQKRRGKQISNITDIDPEFEVIGNGSETE
ncbi:hypothetical protein EDC01DRAFT_631241 [Geopyxis carbonaria]|nr:hypothetical protein EDC01DRAFT_631241 [Geopyxis carbonaria]